MARNERFTIVFFKANVPHLDTPQDHAFFASMYNYASKYKIQYILNGGNFSTECVREPLEWHYHASDLKHIRDIHSKFGTMNLENFQRLIFLNIKFTIDF